ncbi:hypothetical protein BDQ17DRAFT_1520433 [Cyathus striatus]|nr:hypothetical protein BDQ17DRAFT_1520433 [Cyathus striatus]
MPPIGEDSASLKFSQKPEWADVVPVLQYENVNPLAPIFYSEEYKDATDYFRGIVKSGEKSDRVLTLTEAIIRQNPAHYSAWYYRYETLLAINTPLDVELKLMDELAVKYLKTYQVWHHRRLLLTITRKPADELEFIARSLKVDAKNYHTWSYRQWLLAYFNDEEDLWTGELDFVDTMLNQDVRNNSAWHHRFFVVWGCGVREGEEDRSRILKRELIYVKQNISLAPNNPSAWNYLRGILEHNSAPYSALKDFVAVYTVPHSTDRTEIVDLELPPPDKGAELPCAQAIEFLADIYEQECTREAALKATELWRSLANEHDTIRKKYWEHRIRDALEATKDDV